MSESLKATQEMCGYCFDVLKASLKKEKDPHPPKCLEKYIAEGKEFPMFVTFKKFDGSNENLRGCIGSLEPNPAEKLSHYVGLSAFEDRRFDPIEEKELPKLKCDVSILHSFEKCNEAYDWDIDVHGVILEFTHPHTLERYRSTYLPHVVKEHFDNQRVALQSLADKAGYTGVLDFNIIKSSNVTRYKSSVASLSYKEWSQT
eukprot:GHVR01179205.1.p1 GENE.GHVR01179205.1~~GHVR01179205.1.p1  ORF type:complete len:202 (+),score=33.53 GHVR01179205.1:59-664(+)